MSDQSENKPKRSFSIGGLLRIVAITLAVIVFLSTAITNLLMVYIIFGPDDMPKPFYLMYYLPGQSPQLTTASQPTQSPAQVKTPGQANNPSQQTQQHPTGENLSTTGGSIEPGSGVLLDTGSKIVNLADPSGRTFIKTTIVLEFQPNDLSAYANEATAAPADSATATSSTTVKQAYTTSFKEELTAKLPVINDIIITLLSTKKFDQIYTSEGKETLRQEVIQAVNSRLNGYKVIQVYFTEFVVQ